MYWHVNHFKGNLAFKDHSVHTAFQIITVDITLFSMEPVKFPDETFVEFIKSFYAKNEHVS